MALPTREEGAGQRSSSAALAQRRPRPTRGLDRKASCAPYAMRQPASSHPQRPAAIFPILLRVRVDVAWMRLPPNAATQHFLEHTACLGVSGCRRQAPGDQRQHTRTDP